MGRLVARAEQEQVTTHIRIPVCLCLPVYLPVGRQLTTPPTILDVDRFMMEAHTNPEYSPNRRRAVSMCLLFLSLFLSYHPSTETDT